MKCAFTAGWRTSAAAQTFVSRSLTVGFVSPSRSRATSRSRSSSDAGHVDRDGELEDRRLPGLGEAARDRLARRGELDLLDLAGRRGGRCRRGLRRRDGAALDVLGDDPALGAAAAAAVAMSIPFSRASRRASGEALTRPSGRTGASATAAVAASAVAAAASWPRSRWSSIPAAERALRLRLVLLLDRGLVRSRPLRPARPPFPEGTSSPSLPMKAIVRPTSTSPESTTIFSRTPSASASTSCVTLSVSSS